MKTSVVYVATSEFELNIFLSVKSLVQSGSSFDEINVYSVGGGMDGIKRLNAPINVNEVRNRDEEYFFMNKTHMENEKSERVIYIDSDTLILGNIDNIYEGKKSDFIAKRVHNYDKTSFDHKAWSKILKKRGAKLGPYFNAGFVVFQNGIHKDICDTWKKTYKEEKNEYDKRTKKVANRERVEQMSLSISVLKEGAEIKEMEENHHVYGWEKSPSEIENDSIVYHTGSRGGRHLKYASAVARRHNLSLNTPLISSPTHPLFLKLQGYDLGYRAKHFFAGVGG